jgi:hypothetical protein
MNGNLKRLIVDRPVDRQYVSHRRYAAVAGLLCAGASLCTLASSLALDATSAMVAIGLAVLGLLLACLCFVVPWERVGARAIQLAPALATVAVAVATTAIDPTYGFYLVLVAGFVAYSYTRTRVIGLHLALIALALVAPIVLDPEGARKALACALIFGPGVMLVTATAVYQRRSSEARDRAYREFATDALALAARIRSRVGPVAGTPVNARELPEAPSPVIPLRSVGVAKVVRTSPTNGTAGPSPAHHRLPMTAVAVAASVIATVATTAAVVREGGDAPVATKPSLPLVDRAAPRAHSQEQASRAARHKRGGKAPAATESAVTAPATPPTTPAEPTDSGGGGGSQPATPAPPSGTEAPVPVRPQAGAAPPPTPVQQGAPAGPVETALDLVEQTAGPVVSELKP